MRRPPTGRFRRAVVAATAACAIGGLVAPAALAQVSPEDIDEAEAVADAARQRLEEVEADLDEAIGLETRLEDMIESVAARRVDVTDRADTESAEVRSRLTRMYMAAGRSDLALFSVGDLGVFFTRIAYLAALADRDREVLNQITFMSGDLDTLERRARAELEEVTVEVKALEQTRALRSEQLDDALAQVDELRAEWERQEAARRAAIEEELRRQEQEIARQATTTTTTTATTATTTTSSAGGGSTATTVPGGFSNDDGGYTYVPGGGVEQWRPLLTSIFARWGLDREKCGPNGCLGPHIDDALTIMWCESRGVPWAVNPSSGTTGLFQHRPPSSGYWADRVARTRAKPWSDLPADATAYNPAHNIEVAALLIWESRETLIGNLSYGRPWSDGPEPFGHWDGTSRYCADPPLVWP